MMSDNQIMIIDETLREGMQYRGVMFSLEQRIRILEFQEKLGVDICQAGYPSAHTLEAKTVSDLCKHAKKNRMAVRVAAMGRAAADDADILLKTGVRDLHFHAHIKKTHSESEQQQILDAIAQTARAAQKRAPGCMISVALLDIGKSDDDLLSRCVTALDRAGIDIVSLPDTSGIMAPNQVFDKIQPLSKAVRHAKIAVHCHNDMGMAGANAVTGIQAGGRVLEASALGIGERNGIADLFVTARHLKDQGFAMGLNTNDIATFEAYYNYLDNIVFEQTGLHLLTVNTPVFGDAVKTHVAGSHAGGGFGIRSEEKIFLNALCGKRLVKRYLDHNGMDYTDRQLHPLTLKIKSESYKHNRSLSKTDVKALISSLKNK